MTGNRRIDLYLLAAAAVALGGCSDASGGVTAAERAQPASTGGAGLQAQGNGSVIDILDDCDPADPWPGGCVFSGGRVTLAEFQAFAISPLSNAVVGHPSWRNEPSYIRVNERQPILVKNRGGRPHTLTPVAQFGGGRVPPLNVGLQMAPECALAAGADDPWLVPAGGSMMIRDLGPGVHRLMCCFHPWMRQTIVVEGRAHH